MLCALGVETIDVPFPKSNGDEITVTLTMDADEQKRAGVKNKHPNLESFREACMALILDEYPTVLLNDLEAAVHGYNVDVLFNAPYFSWGAALVECGWGRGKAYWRFTRNLGGKEADLVQGIRDGLYTDKVAAPGVYNYSGGNFIPDAGGECASAEALYQHMLYGAEKSIQAQICCDPAISKDADGKPATFDTFVVEDEYKEGITACRSRVESLRLIAQEMEEEGVEGAADAMEGGDDDGAQDDEDEDEE